jgi:ABC-type Zn2+ transport system substrate-binding protein/surface adhesin
MKTTDCDNDNDTDDDDVNRQSIIDKNRKTMYNPYANSHKQLPEMLKQQDIFDKNRTAMDDNYNYLNDAYSACNLGNCKINGFPGGLKPRS